MTTPLLVSAPNCTNPSLRSHAASVEVLCSQGGTTANVVLGLLVVSINNLIDPPAFYGGACTGATLRFIASSSGW